MTIIEQRTLLIEYPYPAHGIRRFAIGLGLALITWGRKRSSRGQAVSYQHQIQSYEWAHAEALRLGGIR